MVGDLGQRLGEGSLGRQGKVHAVKVPSLSQTKISLQLAIVGYTNSTSELWRPSRDSHPSVQKDAGGQCRHEERPGLHLLYASLISRLACH